MKKSTFKQILLSTSVCLLAFSTPVYASLQEALEAVQEKDYTFALEELNRLIEEEGDSEARYQLGLLYEEGAGVQKDSAMALKIFQKASEEGNPNASLKIGNAYYMGDGVDTDMRKAFLYYKKAADKGNYAAQYNLAFMYEEGKYSIPKDYFKAFEYYRRSAEQGYAQAQYSLGKFYLKGKGTPQDYTQAVFWHKLAADQGDKTAQFDLAKLYSNTTIRGLPFNVIGAHVYFNLVSAYGDGTEKADATKFRDSLTAKMDPEEVIAAQQKALDWKKKTRAESLPNKYRGATFLEETQGTVIDGENKEKEEKKDKKSVLSVDSDVQDFVVASGISRRELNKAVRGDDFSHIVEILEKKAEKKAVAGLALGDLYLLGQGMEENPKKAFEIYKGLTEQKNPIAFYKIAPMYCEGNGVAPDLAECYKYMFLANKYADKDSVKTVSETLAMLDENLGAEVQEEGKKLAQAWEDAKAKEPVKEEKKGIFSNIFGSKDSKEEKEKTAEEETEEKTTDSQSTEEVDELFPDL